jgi:hypothetical protein
MCSASLSIHRAMAKSFARVRASCSDCSCLLLPRLTCTWLLHQWTWRIARCRSTSRNRRWRELCCFLVQALADKLGLTLCSKVRAAGNVAKFDQSAGFDSARVALARSTAEAISRADALQHPQYARAQQPQDISRHAAGQREAGARACAVLGRRLGHASDSTL